MSGAGRQAIRALLALAGLFVAGWLVWFLMAERRLSRSDEGLTRVPPTAGGADPAQIPAPKLELAADEVPIMPARPDQGLPDGPIHPHPITAQHQRIFEENRLIGALNGAVDIADVAGIRRLLAQYRAAHPEDAQELQDGYQAIADCLEHPGPETQTAAQRWSDQHHGSTVRRFVMRICRSD